MFQSLDGVGKIGSIRSARPYYLELALGHDAIFIHAGGSEDAYAMIRQWGVDALDGVRGPYMSNTEYGNLMWRDPERKQQYSLEHTVVTTGEMIQERFAGYTNLRQEHEEAGPTRWSLPRTAPRRRGRAPAPSRALLQLQNRDVHL